MFLGCGVCHSLNNIKRYLGRDCGRKSLLYIRYFDYVVHEIIEDSQQEREAQLQLIIE
jgi:hypothetical protein